MSLASNLQIDTALDMMESISCKQQKTGMQYENVDWNMQPLVMAKLQLLILKEPSTIESVGFHLSQPTGELQ